MIVEKAEYLREGVRQAYSAAAERPQQEHPFPVGRAFALSLGYPEELLASLPAVCVEAFSGVSNVSLLAEISKGATVLDLGCGAGLDSLIAAQRVGAGGTVIGIDFSAAMLARAHQAVEESGLHNINLHQADAEQLPVENAKIDVAISNGIFNLNPCRAVIFRELARVVRPDGLAYAAELVLKEPLPPEEQASDANWFA